MAIEKFDSDSLLKNLSTCFAPKELEELARSSQFVMRSTSRLTGQSFVMMNVFDISSGKERSLNDSCDWLLEHFDIDITKQSLDERYNTTAVRFMKACFERILQKVNEALAGQDLNLPFAKIQLTDSTTFKIPAHLAVFYKGYRGNGGLAMLKIHLNYDFLSGQVEDIFLTDGASNDNTYEFGMKEQIVPKALYIRDLGYYDLVYFRKIAQSNAYFLSRGKTDAAYSIKNDQGAYERIDIAQHLPEIGQTKELSAVYLGSRKNKLAVRLILQAVPEHVARQRLEKLKQYASKSKYPVSEQRKKMCYFNVFITNVPKDLLDADMVRILYTVRWQIELMFKIWKSVFDLDKVKKMSIFRFECYIYAKLIAILLTLNIHYQLGAFLWTEQEIELSPFKLARVVKKRFKSLMQVLLLAKEDFNLWFDKTAKLILKRAKKNIRKLKGKPPKPTPWQIIYDLA